MFCYTIFSFTHWAHYQLSSAVALPLIKEWGGRSEHLQCSTPQSLASYYSYASIVSSSLLPIHFIATQTCFLSNLEKYQTSSWVTNLHGENQGGKGGKFKEGKGKRSFILKAKHHIAGRVSINYMWHQEKYQDLIYFDIQVRRKILSVLQNNTRQNSENLWSSSKWRMSLKCILVNVLKWNLLWCFDFWSHCFLLFLKKPPTARSQSQAHWFLSYVQ